MIPMQTPLPSLFRGIPALPTTTVGFLNLWCWIAPLSLALTRMPLLGSSSYGINWLIKSWGVRFHYQFICFLLVRDNFSVAGFCCCVYCTLLTSPVSCILTCCVGHTLQVCKRACKICSMCTWTRRGGEEAISGLYLPLTLCHPLTLNIYSVNCLSCPYF